MKISDLRELLLSVAESMDSLKKVSPKSISEVVSTLNSLSDDALDFIVILVQALNEKATKESVKEDIGNISELIENVKGMLERGEIDRIASVCRNLRNRPIILRLIAAFI